VKRRKGMKVKLFLISFLMISLAGGCAAPPKKEPAKWPSPTTAPSPPPAREKLKELVVPQREEAKKIPEKLYSLSARDANIQEVLLAFSKESELNIIIDPELSGKVTVDLKQVTLKEALEVILSPMG
jgi:type II secretory pathway component GspD/PulD (secretin)